MTFARKSGGSNITPTVVKRKQGGALANAGFVKRMQSGVWVTVYGAAGPLSVSGPSSVSGQGTQTVGAGQPVAATTGTAVCTISGGQAPFTYAWQYVSGTAATVNSPSSTSTNFTRTATGTLIGNTVSGVYRLKVTDATSAVAYGPNCTVTTTHYYDSGA